MSQSSAAELEELRATLVRGIHDANLTRYLSAVGLVSLLYDHALTFSDEVHTIWRAKPSFAKKLFLLNRYAVPIAQIGIAVCINHFSDDAALTDEVCKASIITAFVLGVCSVASGNILVILRVITLWDRDRRVFQLMAIGFCCSFMTTLGFMVTIIVQTSSGYKYVSYVHTCVSTLKSPALPGVWASSMAFETMVLVSVFGNALTRPRGTETSLRRVLFRDGILFFSTLTALRTANLVLSIIARPTLVMCGVFFVWAMTTLVLNRSLLNIQKESNKAAQARMRGESGGAHYRDHSLSRYSSKLGSTVDEHDAGAYDDQPTRHRSQSASELHLMHRGDEEMCGVELVERA